jgi:hypothetical protein
MDWPRNSLLNISPFSRLDSFHHVTNPEVNINPPKAPPQQPDVVIFITFITHNRQSPRPCRNSDRFILRRRPSDRPGPGL